MNTSDHKMRSGFTLPEAIVGMAVAFMIIGSALAVLIQCLTAVQNTMTTFTLATHGRLARENLLRGAGSLDGLREGKWYSMTVNGEGADVEGLTFNVETNAMPTATDADDAIYGIHGDSGLEYSMVPVAGGSSNRFRILVGNFAVSTLDFTPITTDEGRFVNTELELSLTTGGRTFARTERIRTRILNE